MSRELIYSARVSIEGVTELLMHKCGDLSAGKKKTRNAETDYSDEWKKTVYLSRDGIVVMPSMNLEAMMREASKGQKIGKNFLTRIVPTGVSVSEFEAPILVENKTITINDVEKNSWIRMFPVVLKGQRITRTRAAIPIGWEINFTVEVLSKILVPEIMESLLRDAGELAGLCDWRPGSPKPGKFGQFDLKEFIVN